MTALRLSRVATCIPDRTVPASSLPELAELDEPDRAVFEHLGIEAVAADPAATSFDLAAEASSRLVVDLGLDPRDIDALVMIESRVPESFMSSEVARLQAELGATGALILSVGGLGCVSISSALVVARSLVGEGRRNVLIAHGSKPPTPRRFRRPVTVNGDGGMAVLASDGGPITVVDVALETNGAYWDLYRVDFKDRPVSEWFEECSDLRTYNFKLAIESRNRFADMNRRLLERNGLTQDDIDHVVMQNLSVGGFRFYEEALDVTVAKACRENLARYGHLGSMDVLLNLETGLETGEFHTGDRVLVMNASPVAAWSTFLVEL